MYINSSILYCSFCFAFLSFFGYAQEESQEVLLDSVPEKKGFLLEKVSYQAKDSVKINRKKNLIYLYNEAKVTYDNMKLEAGIIILDYQKSNVIAGRIKDSLGEFTQRPVFVQGRDEVSPDSIQFNFNTKKALIWNSRTEQNGLNIFSTFSKKDNDSTYYIKNARITTSADGENPDYYIKVTKGKIVPGGQIVAGPSILYVANVPTPVAIPFGFFPSTQSKKSGFIFPTFGESNDRGYFLQNGGYYIAVSDYFDINLVGDYYTNGSFGLRWDSAYKKLYKYSGNISLRYENLVTGERGFSGFAKNTIFNLRLTHRQDPKSNPNSNLSASVNLGSSNYFTESINQLNNANFLNNNINSSISYSKSFSGYPSVNFSVSANMSQNKNTQMVQLSLPAIQINTERFFPFAPKKGIKKGAFKNINIQYTGQAMNSINVLESELFTPEGLKKARYGVQNRIPLTTNFKVFKYISASVTGNYSEIITQNRVKYNDYQEGVGVVIDTINRPSSFREYNYSASFGTTIYGTVNFKPDSKVQSIRHVIRPTINYNNKPSFERYYDTYIIDAEGNTDEYTPYENSIYGTPSRSKSQNVGISISNTFEAKVKSKDPEAPEPRKIKLLNNLNLNTNYNILADSLRLSPIRISSGINLLKDEVKINFASTMNPYALNDQMQIINKVKPRFTSANMNLKYSISNETFKKDNENEDEEEEEEEDTSYNDYERTSGGGRQDDLFGVANSFSDNRFNQKSGSSSDSKGTSYFRTKIPWDLSLAYAITYNNSRQQNDISNNSLMMSGNIDLTPKWKFGISSGYDFKNKGVTYTQIRVNRDLKSWRLNFDWVPFGTRASWYFFIGIKSGLLSDLKYEKRNIPNRRN